MPIWEPVGNTEIKRSSNPRGRLTTRPPDPTFFALAHAWALGEDLDTVLRDEELTGGDFVRNVKQLIDLLRQIAISAPTTRTSRTAEEAAERLFRGIVAASSVLPETDLDVDTDLDESP